MAIYQLLTSLIFGATLSIGVSFTAGTATSGNSSLVANPNAAVANGAASVSLTFTARDAYNNPAANIIVSLTASGTSNAFAAVSGPTDANGQFTTTLSSSVAQSKSVTATFGSNETVSCMVSFVAGPASAAGSSFVVNPNTAVANNSSTLTAVLILRDAQSNPIAGASPNFAASGASTSVVFSGNTSATGQATASYKTSMAQNENAVVTAGGITLTAPMAFTPGPAFVATSSLVVSPNSTIANNSNTLTAVLTLRDAQSNPIVGAVPSFSASGSSTTLATTGNTSASGQASATYQTSLAQNENASVTAGGITLSAPMSFVAGAASASASSLVVNPNSTTANNSNTLTAVLALRDAQNNPIAGVTPSFSASGASTTVASLGSTTAGGQASATYKTSLAQNENAVVTAGGITLMAPIVFAAGPATATTSSFVASPNSTTADNSNTLTAVLILRDTQSNPIGGITPTFSASGSSTTVTPSGNTTAAGQASATYKTSLTQNENAVVTAGGITFSAPISFTAGPASSITSSFTVSPNSTTANNSNTLTAVLTLRDAQSNPIAAATPIFSASGLSTTVTASGNTSLSGTASATYKTSLAQNENAIVTAAGITLSARTTFVAGPAAAAYSTLTASPNMVTGDGNASISLVATAKDAQNNPVANASVALSAAGGNTSFGAASGTTMADGTYATTLKSTQMQTETITANIAASFNETTSVTFIGVPASCVLSVNPNSQTANGNSTMGLSATVTNSSSQPVSHVRVNFVSTGAAQHFTAQNVITTAAGIATSGLNSLYFGKNVLYAQVGNIQCASQGNFVTRTAYCTANPNYSTATYNTGTYPQGIVAGDFDGDGRQDLAVANYNDATLGIFLGTGTGAFQPQVTYASGVRPTNIAMGDFNGDGMQDLAVVNNYDNTLSVYFGTGTGAFQTQVTYATGRSPQGITTADFNGDGLQDLAVTNFSSGNLGVYINAGTGVFQNAVTYATGTYPHGITTGDFNGDGKQDLAVTNEISSNNIGIFIGTGTGSFAAQVTYATSSSPWVLATGDFNGDGYQDLAVANSSSSTVGIFMGTGTGSFATQVTYATGSTPQGINIGDFNGDGWQDLAVVNSNSTGTLSLLLGTGTGSFQTQAVYNTGNTPASITTADFNGDGKQDLANTNGNSTTISVFLNICP